MSSIPERPGSAMSVMTSVGFRSSMTVRASLAFADYRGNRQMLSTGNLAVNDRALLFLMDYPRRARLKILGHARVEDAREHPELVMKFSTPDVQDIVERVFFVEVVSFDWNCPKYITPRYTAVEVEEAVLPLRRRIAAAGGETFGVSEFQ